MEMERIQEKISYLEGFKEGLDLYQNKKEGKFFDGIIEVISDLNQTLELMNNRLNGLEEYVEAIDEDLNDMEWDFYDNDEDDVDFIDDDDDEYYELDDDSLIDDNSYYQVVCPTCHESVMLDHTLFENDQVDEVVCPNCKEVIIVDTQDHYDNDTHIHS